MMMMTAVCDVLGMWDVDDDFHNPSLSYWSVLFLGACVVEILSSMSMIGRHDPTTAA